MKQYGTQRSTVKPEGVEITESKVFTYESITEIKVKNPESDDEVTMYEFTLTEYDKDEYIRIQAEKNASLIIKGIKTIGDVPTRIKDEVKQELVKEGHPDLAEVGDES